MLVAVHADTPESADHARAALLKAHPAALMLFDANGRTIELEEPPGNP